MKLFLYKIQCLKGPFQMIFVFFLHKVITWIFFLLFDWRVGKWKKKIKSIFVSFLIFIWWSFSTTFGYNFFLLNDSFGHKKQRKKVDLYNVLTISLYFFFSSQAINALVLYSLILLKAFWSIFWQILSYTHTKIECLKKNFIQWIRPMIRKM